MNRNQAKGSAKDMAGKLQRKAGEATGSLKQQAKGLAKQAEGKTQKLAGDVQQAGRDASKGRTPR